MKITALVENTCSHTGCKPKHGLSLYVAAQGETLLFDFGPDGDLLLENAAALGIDLSTVSMAFLSHGHSDHGGGLEAFLQVNHTAPVYVHPDAFLPHYSKNGEKTRFIGLEPALQGHAQICLTSAHTTIGSCFQSFTFPNGSAPHPLFNRTLYAGEADHLVPDTFSHEQCLLVLEGRQAYLFGGCAHSGIANLLEHAKSIIGRPVDWAISGFHLYNPSTNETEPEERIQALTALLAKEPTRFITCHCTGDAAFQQLHGQLVEKIRTISTGDTLELC